MFRERPFLLSALPPTEKQRRLALFIAVLLLAAFFAAVPFSGVQLRRIDSFIPTIDALLFMNDLITSALLYAQYAITRSRGLLALAMGYLFASLVIVAHALTFPGAFSPTGLLGADMQSAVWLYVFWHLGLPTAAIVYALLKGARAEIPEMPRSARASILLSIAAVAALAAALTWLSTAGVANLPTIMLNPVEARSAFTGVFGRAILILSLAAIVIVWRRRSSVLDLWLLVVMGAWFVETLLMSTTLIRYSVTWYVGRTFGLLSASFVLLVLLSESTVLYARLAIAAAARDREREAKRFSLATMAESIAVDLNQPLSAIVANADAAATLLSREVPDVKEARVVLEDIANDALRASEAMGATRTMLAASTEHASLIDMGQLVRETLILLRADLQLHGVTLELETEEHLPPVQGNKPQLLQVLVNLITNAVESMSADSTGARRLRIRSTVHEPGAVAISVEDSGAGFDPAHAGRLFEPFFTTKPQRTGLGLAVCRSIVEAHGGWIRAAPVAGEGCAFHVVLPAT